MWTAKDAYGIAAIAGLLIIIGFVIGATPDRACSATLDLAIPMIQE